MPVTQYWSKEIGTRFFVSLTQDPVRQTVGVDLEVDAYPQTAVQLTVSHWSLRIAYQWVWINKG